MSFKKAPAKRNNTAGKSIKQPEERRTPQQKQSNKTQIIDTAPSGRNPEDLVESFTEMFPDYKSLTKEEIISIFRDYNNDFQAVVNSVMDKTIGIQPSESWTDVPKKKKKKQNQEPVRSGDSQRGGQQRNRDFNRRRPPGAQQKNRSQPPAASAPAATVPQQVTPPANSTASLPPSVQPTQAPTPVVQNKEAFTTPHTPPASTPEPFTNTPPATTAPVTTPSSNFARSTISYANAAKSRQPWSPHTQTATQATLSPVEEESKKLVAEPKAEEPKQIEVPQAAKPAEPVERPAVKPVSVPKQPTPPREPVVSKPAPVEVKSQPPLVVSAPVVPKPTPVEQKQRAGVVLPGSFVTEESMQFQFGNLGIYDEEVESAPETPINIPAPVNVTKPATTNLSNPAKPTPSAPAPAPSVSAAQDYPENLSHVSESENMIPQHLPYAPNQFMPYPFDADSSRPVGHYYDAQAYSTAFSRDGKAYPGGRQTGNQNFGGRDTKYSGQEPGAANTQATAQTPSAPNQGYPYHSMYPYGPFMGQFPSYSTSQFHYQPAPMGYYPAKRAYPSFGSYPSNTGMGYPEDEYKGAYSSIPQQPGSYYMQPGEAANPGLNPRDSKSQSTGQPNTSKPGQSDQGATNPSGTNSFKASGNSNSDAYYPRDTQYGIGNTSFMSQGFYPHPSQIVPQTQPNTPYQPNRSNY